MFSLNIFVSATAQGTTSLANCTDLSCREGFGTFTDMLF